MDICFSGTTEIQVYHSPNEGRTIINNNDKALGCAITSLASLINTGGTIVTNGDANIEVALSGVSVYAVSLNDNIILNSISSTTISADTYYIGSTPLSSFLTGSTYATTLVDPSSGITNTITHNFGTTDITVQLWLDSGDLTNARVTNRLINSVDVIFNVPPGENVRVIVQK